jgi:hypothetical protein
MAMYFYKSFVHGVTYSVTILYILKLLHQSKTLSAKSESGLGRSQHKVDN